MKIKVFTIGRYSLKPARELIAEYIHRIGHYAPLETFSFRSVEEAIQKLKRDDFLILLDERGKHFDSVEFAKWIEEKQNRSAKTVIFLLGPAEGFSGEAKARADLLLSLSEMTLQHELALVVLMEQIYRAFTILKGEPYHKS